MDWFYGFDLGDAESAGARLEKESRDLPEVLEIREEKSIITAYALLKNGDVLIGEGACYDPDALERKIRFKSKFLTDESVVRDVKSFAGALLGELYLSGDLIKGLENCFYVGCPAGWSRYPPLWPGRNPPMPTDTSTSWRGCWLRSTSRGGSG